MSYETYEVPAGLVIMTCPYDSELCGAPATLSDFEVRPLDETFAGGWRATLTCINRHRFVIGQPAVEQ